MTEPLLERLADPDETVRRLAVIDVADLEDDENLPRLAEVLQNDPAASVRAEAARVLAGWDESDVVEALAAALRDPDKDVQKAAASSLSELKDPAMGAHLVPYAGDAQASVRAAALRSLR